MPTAERAFDAPSAMAAWDCHMHLFDSEAHYPLSANATYTPPVARLEDYDAVRRDLGIAFSVIVQPSVYGADNRLVLETIARQPDRFVGIACIDAPLDADAAVRLRDAGVRGVRINSVSGRDPGVKAVESSVDALRAAGLCVQIAAPGGRALPIARPLIDAGLTVVLDHFAMVNPADPESIDPLLRMLEGGRAWIKLSACYRVSRSGPPDYADLGPLVRRLRDVRADRLLWGSDWPHPEFPHARPDDRVLASALAKWGLADAERHLVLEENPPHLYGKPTDPRPFSP